MPQTETVVSDGSHRVFWTGLSVCLFSSWGDFLLERLHVFLANDVATNAILDYNYLSEVDSETRKLCVDL